MLLLIVLWWVCAQLAAPTWCFVLLAISATWRIIFGLVKVIVKTIETYLEDRK